VAAAAAEINRIEREFEDVATVVDRQGPAIMTAPGPVADEVARFLTDSPR
jgi:hypothetical protein